LDGPAIFECNVKSRLRGFEIVHRAGELLARDKGVGFALMPEWMATGILALLLGLAGGFAAHYTLLTLGVIL
jgi:hypothetical protein